MTSSWMLNSFISGYHLQSSCIKSRIQTPCVPINLKTSQKSPSKPSVPAAQTCEEAAVETIVLLVVISRMRNIRMQQKKLYKLVQYRRYSHDLRVNPKRWLVCKPKKIWHYYNINLFSRSAWVGKWIKSVNVWSPAFLLIMGTLILWKRLLPRKCQCLIQVFNSLCHGVTNEHIAANVFSGQAEEKD